MKALYSNLEGLPPDRIIPTVGLNIDRVELSNTKLVFWDLGGQVCKTSQNWQSSGYSQSFINYSIKVPTPFSWTITAGSHAIIYNDNSFWVISFTRFFTFVIFIVRIIVVKKLTIHNTMQWYDTFFIEINMYYNLYLILKHIYDTHAIHDMIRDITIQQYIHL